MINSFLTLALLLSPLSMAWAAESHDVQQSKEAKEESPPKIGNFLLPGSQQPGPLISIGQNIIDKNQTLLFLLADAFKGPGKESIDVVPSLLYGITDDFSVLFTVPFAARYREDQARSAGVEDMSLQFEYSFYGNKTSSYTEQATILGNVSFPTGSTKKDPSTGTGSPNFLLGATYNRVWVDWFAFTSPGVVLTTIHDGVKAGNQFLYQFGVGRNIATLCSNMTFAGIVEVTGQYVRRDKVRGITDPNSGGNTIYITPSLWLSSEKFIAQLGFGVPVVQNLFGEQKRDNYSVTANFAWTF